MHDLALTTPSSHRLATPIQKTVLDDRDLLAVARIIRQGWSEGHYLHVIPRQPSATVVAFLRHIACECELPTKTPAVSKVRARAAALLVYVLDGMVVGFAVLAESSIDSYDPAVEILMLGVAESRRGRRLGSAILDCIADNVSRHGFSLRVCCPSNNNFFFVILVSHGFAAVGRNHQGRMLQLRPARYPHAIGSTPARGQMPRQHLDSHLPPYED